MYCRQATPVFNRSDLEKVFRAPLTLSKSGFLRATEFVALEGVQINILAEREHVFEIEADSYISEGSLYIPKNASLSTEPYLEKKLPPIEVILSELKKMVGIKYIWGGNYTHGIDQMLTWFPPNRKLNDDETKIWTLAGVDCSGMLYEATVGFTPRNTKEMHQFGVEVDCREPLEPLDLIVWEGHVVIVLDEKTTIEARDIAGCVYTSPLKERLAEAMIEAPNLTIRRWM
jgi:hypothetical protein